MIYYKGVSEKQKVHVAVLTPYLNENFEQVLKGRPDYYQCMDKALESGYDRNNFCGISQFETPKHLVLLEKGERVSIDPKASDLCIAGSNNVMRVMLEQRLPPPAWIALATIMPDIKIIMNWKDSGLIVARYSMSYGGRSKTGNLPEETGYSLDIPKKVPVVKAFITDDAVLDALVSREEERIRSAIEDFNQDQAEPVLVTPFLREALRVRK